MSNHTSNQSPDKSGAPTARTVEKPAAYRKGTFEAKLDSMLPAWENFDVIAHELLGDGEGGWSVNDSWHLGRGLDREEAISILRSRWEIFKVNYMAKAHVCDLQDVNWSGDEFPCLLEVNCTAFAEIRNATPQPKTEVAT